MSEEKNQPPPYIPELISMKDVPAAIRFICAEAGKDYAEQHDPPEVYKVSSLAHAMGAISMFQGIKNGRFDKWLKPEAKKGPWKAMPHSYQLGCTGDYDGHWEITDGKISIFTKDDPEDDELDKVAHALNQSECKFYLDDSFQFCYHHEKQRADTLEKELAAANQKIKELNDWINSHI